MQNILAILAKNLADFDNKEKTFEFDGCPYLFEPKHTDEEVPQTEDQMTKEGNNKQRWMN